MSDQKLGALLLERARRRAAQDSGEPVEVRLARIRESLVAAFGEADMAAADAINTARDADVAAGEAAL